MFREMRRKQQALSLEEMDIVLERGTSGVLAVSGDDGYPYAVPLNYVYHEGKLFFHGAQTGHKLDAIAGSEKVSFCVIDQDEIVADEYTSYFRSVIVFGRARVVTSEGEKREAFELLAAKYSPDHEEGRLQAIERQIDHVCIIKLVIDHMTGKEATELTKRKGRKAAL